jgi:hypothetical protein
MSSAALQPLILGKSHDVQRLLIKRAQRLEQVQIRSLAWGGQAESRERANSSC